MDLKDIRKIIRDKKVKENVVKENEERVKLKNKK